MNANAANMFVRWIVSQPNLLLCNTYILWRFEEVPALSSDL